MLEGGIEGGGKFVWSGFVEMLKRKKLLVVVRELVRGGGLGVVGFGVNVGLFFGVWIFLLGVMGLRGGREDVGREGV